MQTLTPHIGKSEKPFGMPIRSDGGDASLNSNLVRIISSLVLPLSFICFRETKCFISWTQDGNKTNKKARTTKSRLNMILQNISNANAPNIEIKLVCKIMQQIYNII